MILGNEQILSKNSQLVTWALCLGLLLNCAKKQKKNIIAKLSNSCQRYLAVSITTYIEIVGFESMFHRDLMELRNLLNILNKYKTQISLRKSFFLLYTLYFFHGNKHLIVYLNHLDLLKIGHGKIFLLHIKKTAVAITKGVAV